MLYRRIGVTFVRNFASIIFQLTVCSTYYRKKTLIDLINSLKAIALTFYYMYMQSQFEHTWFVALRNTSKVMESVLRNRFIFLYYYLYYYFGVIEFINQVK